ncbi:MAG: hypothetical protein ABIF19_14560 [Planctomycetota bacterium]
MRSKLVHKELRLSSAQINDTADAISQVDLPLWRLRDLPLEKRNEAATSLVGQLNNRLSEILSARQLERLNQIVWQAQGVDALLEPQVVARYIWPSTYLVDKNGFVRYWWYGELNWQGAKSEEYLRARIQELVAENSAGN